jgi:hypothetical protein
MQADAGQQSTAVCRVMRMRTNAGISVVVVVVVVTAHLG